MDFIEKLGDTISSKGKEVAEKAKETAEILALKGQISTCEEVIRKNYVEIGGSGRRGAESMPDGSHGLFYSDGELFKCRAGRAFGK